MKKSLVLAMAMALGVTASAYAANPFSDVPAGHWAYDSIDKLAAAGVIDGMGDGTYQGDKTMTRYEMAQIVAKAMAKGANVDKLAAEFADELDNLGVRVANLEKKADNVKITGAINYYYKFMHNQNKADDNFLRSDITLTGAVNEDWTYSAMVRNDQKFDTANRGVGEERVDFQRAWVDGRVGGLKVKAGRYNRTYADKAIHNNRVDGIEASYGKDVKITVGYDQLSANNGQGTANYAKQGPEAKVMFAEIDWKVNKALAIDVDYYKFKDVYDLKSGVTTHNFPADFDAVGKDGDIDIVNLGAKLNVTKNVKVNAQYLHASEGPDKDGFLVGLNYKGANKAKVGSYGVYAMYADLSKAMVIDGAGWSTNGLSSNNGWRGAMIGANYTVAKNMIATAEYWNAENNQKKSNDTKEAVLFNLNFTF